MRGFLIKMAKKKSEIKYEDKRPLCKECGGVGVKSGSERSCPDCGGSGRKGELEAVEPDGSEE
jgi:DnaJ-class molecular chaperone